MTESGTKSRLTRQSKCICSIVVAHSFLFLLLGTSLARVEIVAEREHRISKTQQSKIEADLREKTGLSSIRFDKRGELTYGRSESPDGGSVKMRQAIGGAIDDQMNIFQIGDYSRSRAIQFAETDCGTQDMVTRVTTYQIMIDFADFKNSRRYTSKDVLRSHTVGLTLFHEINHKASYNPADPFPPMGVRPDVSSNGIIGVIENTNLIRKELSLMLRKSTQHKGRMYRGLVESFRDTYQIQFLDEYDNSKNLRWKLE